MSCHEYNELQQRCESKRKKMSHFMLHKPLDWQADPNARTFAKDMQAGILKTAAEIATHQYSCRICQQNLTN
jgi:hypothetical protein